MPRLKNITFNFIVIQKYNIFKKNEMSQCESEKKNKKRYFGYFTKKIY